MDLIVPWAEKPNLPDARTLCHGLCVKDTLAREAGTPVLKWQKEKTDVCRSVVRYANTDRLREAPNSAEEKHKGG